MTRWLDDQQQQQWRALMTGTSALFGALHHDLESETGMAMNEYELLVRLSETPTRSMRMSVLADGLVHSRSRITHTVRRMEQRGLVRRQATATDGRGVECAMTDAGWAALVAAAPVHVASVRRRLVDVISGDELAALGTAFDKVAAGIAEDPPD